MGEIRGRGQGKGRGQAEGRGQAPPLQVRNVKSAPTMASDTIAVWCFQGARGLDNEAHDLAPGVSASDQKAIVV